jgi:putative oxidoreductase
MNPSFTGAALRIVSGALFAYHGATKILGFLATGPQPAVGSQPWLGGLFQLAIGALVAVGLFTRPAAAVGAAVMVFAYVQMHWRIVTATWAFLPTVHASELAALYAVVFLVFAVSGPGGFSIDRSRGRG